MSTHTYKFNIGMSCGGCSGAVERVLKKLDGELPGPQYCHLRTTE
jgi:copper chaperone CopZ